VRCKPRYHLAQYKKSRPIWDGFHSVRRPLGLVAVVIAARLVHCFIHLDLAAIQVNAVGSGDGGLSLIIRTHFHKAEAFGISGITIRDDLRGRDRAVRLEEVGEAALAGVEAKIAHVKFLTQNQFLHSTPYVEFSNTCIHDQRRSDKSIGLLGSTLKLELLYHTFKVMDIAT